MRRLSSLNLDALMVIEVSIISLAGSVKDFRKLVCRPWYE